MAKPMDLSQCDVEPIRFINSIQPFGAIIVLDDASNKIKCHSKNFFDLIGQVPDHLLDKDFNREMLPLEYFSITETKVGTLKIIQVEKKTEEALSSLSDHLDRLQKTASLEDLLNTSAEIMENITGFDRVMIYKFHEDSHGEVVAEKLRAGIESFMGLHYPASDIPTPARAIFLENWIRMIPDVHYTPIALESSLSDIMDLGRILLRAVSPIHIEYLKNMNVGASFTTSIIVENKLWGLIACHHLTPKIISKAIREKCEIVGRYTSSLICEASFKERTSHSGEIKILLKTIAQSLDKTDDMATDIMTQSPALINLMNAQGASASLYANGYWLSAGNTPSKQALNRLVDWLAQEHPDKAVYHSHEISSEFPEALAYKDIASGVLAISVPKTVRNYILFFRPEVIQTINWAGNPDKTVTQEDGRLTPRASFLEWKKTYYGKSIPWQSWEIDAALALRNLILGVDLKEQFIKEQKARAEAEIAKNAREDLMAVVSHDLRNPLTSIEISTHLLKKNLSSGDVNSLRFTDLILKSTSTMNNLINDILSVAKLESGSLEVSKKLAPIGVVIEEAVEMLYPIASKKNINIVINKQLGEFPVEHDFERILQVLSNLIGNSIKFTPINGRISISIKKSGPLFIKIIISDTGPGIPPENLPFIFDRFWQAKQTSRVGVGLGLSIAKGIVVAHGGEIRAESKLGAGSSFQFTLPAEF